MIFGSWFELVKHALRKIVMPCFVLKRSLTLSVFQNKGRQNGWEFHQKHKQEHKQIKLENGGSVCEWKVFSQNFSGWWRWRSSQMGCHRKASHLWQIKNEHHSNLCRRWWATTWEPDSAQGSWCSEARHEW